MSPVNLTERELQAQVIELAKLLGWMVYHTYDSRKSEPGYPDLTMAHADTGAVIWAELKREGQLPTAAQRRWLMALGRRHLAVLWQPSDLRSGLIARQLQALGRPA